MYLFQAIGQEQILLYKVILMGNRVHNLMFKENKDLEAQFDRLVK